MNQHIDNPDSDNQSEKTPEDRNIVIENKVDFLINLNLIMLNLVISLNSKDHLQEPIPDHILNELISIHQTLPKILTAGESRPVFIKQIEKLNVKLAEMVGTAEIDETEERETGFPSSQALPVEPKGAYQRHTNPIDKWGIIESLETILISYTALSHLAVPEFYLSACKEIQRYELLLEITHANAHEIIQIPALKLRDLVLRLLREAPAARLLQNLKKLYPLQATRELVQSELLLIQDIVDKYISHIVEYLNGIRSLDDTIRISTTILQQYNLGPGDLESRIPNVSFTVVKEIHKEFQKASGNDFKQYIYSETIVLIHRLNGAILQNERYQVLLRRLK